MQPAAFVGDYAHVSPLIPAVSGDDDVVLLALSQGRVRLFDADRTQLTPMSLGGIPGSIDDVERRGEREPQLQHQHEPRHNGNVAAHHGHSGASDIGEVRLEKFMLEVANGVRSRLGASDTRPLILAAVSEHLPRLRATGLLPNLVDEAIAGNPDEASARELHDRALPLVERLLTERRDGLHEDLTATLGTGLASLDVEQIVDAARHGRVGHLFVDPEAGGQPDPQAGPEERRGAMEDTRVDQAILAAAATGAELHHLADLPDGVACAAVLRY